MRASLIAGFAEAPELTEELNKALAERDRKKGLESRAA